MALNSSTTTAWADATATQYNNLRKDVIARAGEYAVTTGSANAYVLAEDAQIVAYETGQIFQFKVNFTNTATCTLNVNSIAAKTMKDIYWNTLPSGAVQNGSHLICRYDGTDIIVLCGLTDTYSVNTGIPPEWKTWEIPMLKESATLMEWWTHSAMNVTEANAGGYISLATASTNGVASTLIPWTGTTAQYSPSLNKRIRIKWRAQLPAGTGIYGVGLCVTPANIYTAQSDTTNGEIRFVKTATGTIYAQNANGTATSTDLSAFFTAATWQTYEIVFNPGTNILFYIDGVLRATHTTNIPTTGTLLFAIGGTNNNNMWFTPPVVSLEL